MGRYKKGQKQRNKDLWKDAGGREAVVKAFIAYNISKKKKITTETWSNLAIGVFKQSNEKLIKWLMLIWKNNRQGIHTEVLCKGKTDLNFFGPVFNNHENTFS